MFFSNSDFILQSFEGRLSLPSLSIGQALKVCILLSCVLLTHLERQTVLVLGRSSQPAAGWCVSAIALTNECRILPLLRVGISFRKHVQGPNSVPFPKPSTQIDQCWERRWGKQNVGNKPSENSGQTSNNIHFSYYSN